MQGFTSGLLTEMEASLSNLYRKETNTLQLAAAAIDCISHYLQLLRSFILKYRFKSVEEEISFFKTQKPRFVSQYIYFRSLYQLEAQLPVASNGQKRQYYQAAQTKLHHFFVENGPFYQYVRTGATYLDQQYFTRGNDTLQLITDVDLVDADPKFSTGYCYKLACIQANTKLLQYLDEMLCNDSSANQAPISQDYPKPALQWTESKAALVELIYALHTQDVFDKGRVGLKDIAIGFEYMFNVKLGDYYRLFLDIRMRKSGRTKFIDSMKENLLRRMDEIDDRF